MTSAASADFDAMVSSVYGVFGEPARYVPREGSPAPYDVTVVVVRGSNQYGETARIQAANAVLCVRRAEVPDPPRRGDKFEVEDGPTWAVDGPLVSDEFEHRVTVGVA